MSPITDELLLRDDFVEDSEETDDESDEVIELIPVELCLIISFSRNSLASSSLS